VPQPDLQGPSAVSAGCFDYSSGHLQRIQKSQTPWQSPTSISGTEQLGRLMITSQCGASRTQVVLGGQNKSD